MKELKMNNERETMPLVKNVRDCLQSNSRLLILKPLNLDGFQYNVDLKN